MRAGRSRNFKTPQATTFDRNGRPKWTSLPRRVGEKLRPNGFVSPGKDCVLPTRPPNNFSGPDPPGGDRLRRLFFLQFNFTGPTGRRRMKAEFSDLAKIKLRGAIAGSHLQRAAKAAFGGIEIFLRKFSEGLLE